MGNENRMTGAVASGAGDKRLRMVKDSCVGVTVLVGIYE